MTALEVGLLASVAWRADGQVHVHLHLPDVSQQGSVVVRFRDGERRVRRLGVAAAAEPGALVEVAVPAPRLAGGLWRIAVRVGDADAFTRVEARLLVRRGQPVALIPGPEPKTRLPEPEPASGPVQKSVTGEARRLAGRVVGAVRRRLVVRR